MRTVEHSHRRPSFRSRFQRTVETLERRDLLSSQGLDASFDVGAQVATDFGGSDYANSVAIQPDGKLVVVGSSAQPATPGGPLAFNGDYDLMRINPDGSGDISFGNLGLVKSHFGATGTGAQDVVIQSDGKLLVIGSAGLVRYNSNGSLDTSFGAGGIINSAGTSWVAVEPDGKIVTAGPELRRFNADGTADSSFGTGGVVSGSDVSQFLIAPDGKIIATHGNVVWRYNADGTLDSTFGSGGRVDVPAASYPVAGHDTVKQEPQGKIVWVGSVPGPGGSAIEVVRLNPDGKVDASFGRAGIAFIQHGPNTDPFAALVESDGKIFIAGRSGAVVAGNPPLNFHGGSFTARLNSDGSLDPTWGVGGISQINLGLGTEIHGIAQQSDGKIVLAGGTGPRTGLPDSDLLTMRLDGDFNRSFVGLTYLRLLSRDVDPAGLAYFTAALDEGRLTREQAIQAIQSSKEFRENLINQLYHQLLSRPADQGALDYWSAFLAAGGTREQIQIAILGSDEYFAGMQNSTEQFLRSVYNQYLHRIIDPATLAYYERAMASGLSRSAVAASIVLSPEYERTLIGASYLEFFVRVADSDGLNFYTSQMAHGVSYDQIVDELVRSNEYFAGV